MRRDKRGRSGSDRFRFSGHNFRNDFSGFSRPREMHKATCAECGQSCEVPFKPTEGRPVFCKGCFRKNKPARF